jgi:hypothetical protein
VLAAHTQSATLLPALASLPASTCSLPLPLTRGAADVAHPAVSISVLAELLRMRPQHRVHIIVSNWRHRAQHVGGLPQRLQRLGAANKLGRSARSVAWGWLGVKRGGGTASARRPGRGSSMYSTLGQACGQPGHRGDSQKLNPGALQKLHEAARRAQCGQAPEIFKVCWVKVEGVDAALRQPRPLLLASAGPRHRPAALLKEVGGACVCPRSQELTPSPSRACNCGCGAGKAAAVFRPAACPPASQLLHRVGRPAPLRHAPT